MGTYLSVGCENEDAIGTASKFQNIGRGEIQVFTAHIYWGGIFCSI